jgi:glycosyltransferase involved in cell wall biosynthesis
MVQEGAGKKNVLFVVDKSGFGGIQTIAYTLMSHGFSDVSMTYFFLRNLNARFGMREVEQHNVLYSRSRSRYGLTSFLELVRIVRDRDIDILHLNGNKSIIFGVMAKLLLPRLRIIAHEHGGVFDYRRGYLLFVRLFGARMDVIVSLSEYRKRFLMSRCGIPAEKIRVMYNFVDTERVRRGLAEDAGNPSEKDGFVIGYLGGLSRIKGCDVLLRAVSMLRERLGGFRVIVAGEGPARQELEGLASRLGVDDSVSFLGYVREPAQVYAGFDVMVIPSRSEAGPMCLYEAWTMGLPVVASNAPVLDEIIADGVTGLLFESENPQDLADKVLSLYEDAGLRERIKAAGSREVVDRSVDRYLERLTVLYASL